MNFFLLFSKKKKMEVDASTYLDDLYDCPYNQIYVKECPHVEVPSHIKNECPCGMSYLRECPHIGEKSCPECSPGQNISLYLLRGSCVVCLFSGDLEWEEAWNSLEEILSGIALGVYKLGQEQKKDKRCLIPLQTLNPQVKALYELYKAGWESQN